MLLHWDAVCRGGVQEGRMSVAQLSAGFQSLPLLPTSKLGPSGADSPVAGFMYVIGPCGSPKNSPVRLGVSPTTSTPTGVFSQRFEALFPCWSPGLCGLSHSPVVPPGLSACQCGLPTLVASPPRLAAGLHPSYQSG